MLKTQQDCAHQFLNMSDPSKSHQRLGNKSQRAVFLNQTLKRTNKAPGIRPQGYYRCLMWHYFVVWLGPGSPHIRWGWYGAMAHRFSGLIYLYFSPQRETSIINRTKTPTTGWAESFMGVTREERQQMKCNCNGSRGAGLVCRRHWCVCERERKRKWTGQTWGNEGVNERLRS